MNKALTILAIALFSASFTSCEKCATCVTTEDDPLATSEERTTEICGRGRNYSDQLDVYERTNWECTEK